MSAAIAALSAAYWSMRFAKTLSISARELSRYLMKSMNLAACYASLGTGIDVRTAEKAGRAGFLSCAYDVVTDWRAFDVAAGRRFASILQQLAAQESAELALVLYDKDRRDCLDNDGLERGQLALQFVCQLMRIDQSFDRFSCESLGTLLQIVDDVLDLESDVTRGELNCLQNDRRGAHLEALVEAMPDLRRLFRRHLIMQVVLSRADHRARELLAAR